MAKPDTAAYKTFDQITGRLDQIVSQVRDKDTSLERSLDLFDEAIALGSKAVDMVDRTDFTPEEEAKLREQAKEAEDAAAPAEAGEKGAEEPAEGKS
jgi:exodeoxyribonuclease VII small subunit